MQLATCLPCPFCGELPRVGPPDFSWTYVACISGDCYARPRIDVYHYDAQDAGGEPYMRLQRLAVMRWNHRCE